MRAGSQLNGVTRIVRAGRLRENRAEEKSRLADRQPHLEKPRVQRGEGYPYFLTACSVQSCSASRGVAFPGTLNPGKRLGTAVGNRRSSFSGQGANNGGIKTQSAREQACRNAPELPAPTRSPTHPVLGSWIHSQSKVIQARDRPNSFLRLGVYSEQFGPANICPENDHFRLEIGRAHV